MPGSTNQVVSKGRSCDSVKGLLGLDHELPTACRATRHCFGNRCGLASGASIVADAYTMTGIFDGAGGNGGRRGVCRDGSWGSSGVSGSGIDAHDVAPSTKTTTTFRTFMTRSVNVQP